MGFHKTHDIAVKVGSYEKNGEQKNRYENIGYVLTGDDGKEMHFIKRTFNPAGCPMGRDGEDHVLVSIFAVKANNSAPPSGSSAPPPYEDGTY
jgi:hypothetical protein